MRLCNYIFAIALLLLCTCCNGGEISRPTSLAFEPEIVVDGCIECGERPVVILSQIIPADAEIDETILSQVPIRWAKVTITCDGKSEVMTRRNDDELLMGCYYTTSEMRGEVGKSYSIKVEYSGRVATATTTIPTQVALKDHTVTPHGESFMISARIDDPEPKGDRYIILVKDKPELKYYNITLFGVWSDEVLNREDNSVNIYRPINVANNNSIEQGFFFEPNEIIDIKIAHIDQVAYSYWLDHQDLYISNSNLLFPSCNNPRTNVEGGLGCWYGMSAAAFRVEIE